MEPTTQRVWPRLLLAGVASAIIMLSFLIPLARSCMSRDATSAAGSEGAPRLAFSINRGDKALRRSSDDVVLPGDRIRFTYTSEREAQFALLRANSEHAQLVYPHSTRTVPLAAARDAALDLEIEVEKRAGADRFFGLFCDAPLELESVRAMLQKEDDLPALPGCRVARLTLQKKLQ